MTDSLPVLAADLLMTVTDHLEPTSANLTLSAWIIED